MERTLLLATNNSGKVREFRDLLDGCGWRVVAPAEIGLELEVEETGQTYVENARLKAEAFSRASGLTVLADDSGLEVDALDGAPGVHSARYAGQDTTPADNINKLLDALIDVPDARRTARFRAVLVLAVPDGRTFVTEGVCEGRIARGRSGDGGFGYDPVFLVDDGTATMAELPAATKNQISHRARAVAAARAILGTLTDDGASAAAAAEQ